MNLNPSFFREQYEQFLYVIHSYAEAVKFTKKHRLWEGFWRYGWVARLLMLLGVLAGLKFLSVLFNYMGKADVSDPLAAMGLMGSFVKDVVAEEADLFFGAGMRYTLLVFLEILIFHISRRTLNILNLEKDDDLTLKLFLKAQIRMVKISIYCLVLESILSVLVRTGFDVMNFPAFISSVLIFLIQCYFTGFAVVDNYNEQFDMTIKDSEKMTRNFAGVAISLGLMLQVFFLIPVIGSLVGPFLGAVTATLVMFELSNLHKATPTPQPVIPEDELV